VDRINPYMNGFPLIAPQPDRPTVGQTPDETRQAAQDFAGYLFAQVFGQMRPESSEEGGLFSGENAEMFLSFFDQAVGKSFASSGSGNQLVDQLVEQMVQIQSKARQE
jgi:Rod binding domain-containing protein